MKKLTVTSMAAMACAAGLYAQDRPNIVVFLVDDMGLMDTSLPFCTDKDGNIQKQPLNDWYHTPNMERLAQQGIRFSTFYAMSVSSPSRACIMTGWNSARHRTTNWIRTEFNNAGTYGPADWNWTGLRPENDIFPAVLSKAGYKSIHCGKAHFGSGGSIAEDPINLGFDVNIAGNSIGQPGSYFSEDGYGWLHGNYSRRVPGLEKYHNTGTFLTDALTIEAMKAVKECVDSNTPFYLNMAHYAVHGPHQVDKRFFNHYEQGKTNITAKGFATLIEGMDKGLGDLMDQLEAFGVAENTLIIFLGDNGGDARLGDVFDQANCAPFRGMKGTAYEGGMRVPFIAAWAKVNPDNKFQKAYPIAQNAVQTQMGTIMDLYPTILSVAGVDVPEGHVLDGSDLKKLFTGAADKKHRDDFLMHFPHSHRSSYFTVYRKGDWKLIYYYNPEKDGVPTCSLYNLAEDPYENEDLATKEPKRVSKMCKLMISRLQEEGATYPVDKGGKTLYPQVL